MRIWRMMGFSAFEPAAVEKWITDMAGRGYHVTSIGKLAVSFEKEDIPEGRRYRAFRTNKMLAGSEEISLYEDAGWKPVECGKFSLAVLYTDNPDAAEPFTENDSLKTYYRDTVLYDLIRLAVLPCIVLYAAAIIAGNCMEILSSPVTALLNYGVVLPAAGLLFCLMLSIICGLRFIRILKLNFGNSRYRGYRTRYIANCIILSLALISAAGTAAGFAVAFQGGIHYSCSIEDLDHPVPLEEIDSSLMDEIAKREHAEVWDDKVFVSAEIDRNPLFEEICRYTADETDTGTGFEKVYSEEMGDYMYFADDTAGSFYPLKCYSASYYRAKTQRTADRLFREYRESVTGDVEEIDDNAFVERTESGSMLAVLQGKCIEILCCDGKEARDAGEYEDIVRKNLEIQ